MFWKLGKKKINVTETVNVLENNIYNQIKQYGFRKHGRTLHRFVDGDISQVINFQVGQAYRNETHLLYVNIGIRVPECKNRKFSGDEEKKKYYHEYECNMRSRLGEVEGKKEACYDLRKSLDKIEADILRQIQTNVIPAFEVLNSREAILKERRNYPDFDTMNNHLILLEESMIYGRAGDIGRAAELFNMYYKKCYLQWTDNKETVSLKIHLEYLERIAQEMNIEINCEEN